MRQRNRLYTVNKWNKPMFMGSGNLFWQGGVTVEGTPKLQLATTPNVDITGNIPIIDTAKANWSNSLANNYLSSKNAFGISKQANPFSKVNLAQTFSKENVANMGKGLAAAGAGIVGGLVGNQLSGGLKSAAGDAISSIGGTVGGAVSTVNPVLGAAVTAGTQILGGITNGLFGTNVDQEKLNAANEGTNELKSYQSKDSFDDIQGIKSVAAVQNAYSSGLLNKSWAKKRNKELREARKDALGFSLRGEANDVARLAAEQNNDLAATYAAYGGPLDFGGGALNIMQDNLHTQAINRRTDAIAGKGQSIQTGYTGGAKTFAGGGGLEASFLGEFGSDPIGAAVRYNRGLEALAAQEEAEQIEAQRQAEYAAMQERLANLETENQGLQAMMTAIPSTLAPSVATPTATPEVTESGRTPATGSDYSDLMGFIKSHEGFRTKAYWLPGESAPTIGYGFHITNPVTGKKIKMGDTMTREEADLGLRTILTNIGDELSRKVPNWDKLKPNQQHALIDLAYGTGTGGRHFKSNSRLMTALRNGDMERAERELVSRSASLPEYDKYLLEISKRRQDMFRNGNYSMKAFGGELGTNGTDFTNGLLYVDEGGTHEENPLDGVPMGLDSEGVPNLVEEGETVYDNYVFSDRMMVPDFMLKDLGLPKSKKGISFADASKKLAQESEQRPNDPLSQDGLDASLSRLAEIQETERMKKQAEEYMGLEEYACGGKLGNKFVKGGPKPYAYSKSWDGFKYFDPKTGKYDEGYLDFVNNISQDWLDRIFSEGHPYGSMDRYLAKNKGYALTPQQASALAQDKKYSDMHKAMAAAYEDYRSGMNPKTGEIKPDIPTMMEIAENMGLDVNPTGPEPEIGLDVFNPKTGELVDEGGYRGLGDPKTYATWMRYAPVVGAGIMSLTDALGLTNNPDYTYADRIAAAAERAGYAPKIGYNPIGDYMRYNPFDRNYWTNQLMANARATDRALGNTSSPSKAAGLLANGYNTTLALGNLGRQGEEYNRAMYERTKEFNRKTNMFNSQMGLEADMANARYYQAAQQMGLSGIAQAAAMRDQIDARNAAARSANLTNFLTSLGNIGRENFAMNQINTDRSRHYYGNLSGNAGGYKAKRGGKLNRK